MEMGLLGQAAVWAWAADIHADAASVITAAINAIDLIAE
jgi:hypothetical protein